LEIGVFRVPEPDFLGAFDLNHLAVMDDNLDHPVSERPDLALHDAEPSRFIFTDRL
jgi:hypothetical protein